MELFDNINRILKDDLKLTTQKGSKLSVAAACFSIYAFADLKDQLEAIVLTGWAEDVNAQAPLQKLYLKVGEHIFQCNYGINRPDLSVKLGYTEAANYGGFQIELPRLLFAGVSNLEFIGISADGSCKYPPVVVPIKGTD